MRLIDTRLIHVMRGEEVGRGAGPRASRMRFALNKDDYSN